MLETKKKKKVTKPNKERFNNSKIFQPLYFLTSPLSSLSLLPQNSISLQIPNPTQTLILVLPKSSTLAAVSTTVNVAAVA